MAVQPLYTAATGMAALETKLSVIANNMANINTTGFKRDRVNFEDLFYRQQTLPGSTDADGNITATGIDVGLGVRVQSTQADFAQGAAQSTSRQLDFAIDGPGFFQVTNPAGGQPLVTRAGNFNVNANGDLVLGSANNGFLVEPAINIPQEATGVTVTGDGQVLFSTNDSTDLQQAGNLQVATFINPDGLLKLGDNLFQETEASGAAQTGNPGDPGFGTIQQGSLEASNVEPVVELIDLIQTQRAFELNSQVVEAGDEALQLIANLRRG